MPTLGGTIYLGGILAIGLAAVNTGNNLLFLLLGALLGTVAVSGWLSERVLRGLVVRRIVPRGVTAGGASRVGYEVRNRKARLPTLDVEIREEGVAGSAYLARLDPGEVRVVRSDGRLPGRGVYPLGIITLSTTFPFGLIRKERDLHLPGELVVWPRSDRRIDIPAVAATAGSRRGTSSSRTALGHRGEYRGLREYRAGDDLRDVHWRKSASAPNPVVREYEPEAGWEVRLHLDAGRPSGRAAEEAVADALEDTIELTASLAARAAAQGRSFVVRTPDGREVTGSGPGALEAALDRLARVELGGPARRSTPPPDPRAWILLTAGPGGSGYGAVIRGSAR